MPFRRDQRRADPLKEEQIGEEADEREKAQCDVGADDADDECEGRDHQQPGRGGEVREVRGDVVRASASDHDILIPI